MSGLSFNLGTKRPADAKAQKPVKVADLFGADSDGEEEAPAQDAKKARALPSATPAYVPPAAKPVAALPPTPVLAAQLAAAAAPPAASTSRWGPAPPAAALAAPMPSASLYGRQEEEDFEKVQARRALEKGDSVAAMDAYMKLMAKKAADKEKEEREEEEERRRREPLLNETSFDRRKVTAVFKSDGSRGHHMSDFIPPEELAKLLAKGGGEAAKAAAEALEKRNAITSDNIGHKLLSKMGWKEGEAVGASKTGITAPVQAGSMKQDNLGLGAQAHGEVTEGDDAFEQYRKRMMLGYKHRPNPLGNPRKSYY